MHVGRKSTTPTLRASFVRNRQFIDIKLLFLIILFQTLQVAKSNQVTYFFIDFCLRYSNFVRFFLQFLLNFPDSSGKLICQVASAADDDDNPKSPFINPFQTQAAFCIATTKACPRLRLPMKTTCARDNADHPVRYMLKSRLHQQKIEFHDWRRMHPFYGSGRRQLPVEYQIPH